MGTYFDFQFFLNKVKYLNYILRDYNIEVLTLQILIIIYQRSFIRIFSFK